MVRPYLSYQFRLVFPLILFFMSVPMVGAQQNHPPDITGADVETYKSVDGVDLRLWIFKPEAHPAEDPRPAIIFFFGGGWNSGNPVQFNSQARHFQSRGMVAVLADYRVKSRNGVQARSCVEDAKSALRWLRANAQRLGIDPARIVAAGGSAGGHLAASTATLPMFDNPDEDAAVSSRPNALVLFNPVTITAAVEGIEELSEWQQKMTHARLGTEPVNLSPYHNLGPDLPPTIIFHGTADTTVPHLAAEIYSQKAQALGARCELVSYDGAGHGFFNYGRGDNKAFKDTLARTDAFLVSLGYLKPME